MTDAIRPALAGPLARQAPATGRSALAGEEEAADFGSALLEPKQPPKGQAGAEVPHGKRLQQLLERLAEASSATERPEPLATTAAAEDTIEASPSDEASPAVAETDVEPEAPDEAPGAAMPLLIALSELRKAASQPANAASEDGEAAAASHPDASGETPAASRPSLVLAGLPPRNPSDGISPPPGTAVSAEARGSDKPGTTPADAPGQLVKDIVVDADRPRPAQQSGQADQPAAAGRVSVVAEQFIPAPATPGPSGTTGALALAIASGAPGRSAAAAAAQVHNGTSAPGATHVLKIQLRPVELGMVTASLRLSGEQLSVEIEVENAEAYQRLSADREALTSALRGLGFEVDRLTIQQPQASAGTPARNDGSAFAGGAGGRDQPAFQSGGTGSEGGGSGSGQAGRRAPDEDGNLRNISTLDPGRPGSSLYI
ncbi:flagellar hook-length control protein FliK [Aminobacter sp. Piv2-1]|uniref:flagellar hook-length control protein FliK n=1 Tax=Aminobacter sp. Piv2-1 TaxID=3031122 RepID=UPI0030AE1D33